MATQQLRNRTNPIIPPTDTRIPRSSSYEANAGIKARTLKNVELLQDSSKVEIETRLITLDNEWDIERIVGLTTSSIATIGFCFGFWYSAYWYVMSFVSLFMLEMHALQGWTPLLPLFRNFGVRTFREINAEREGLRIALGESEVFASKDPLKVAEHEMRYVHEPFRPK